jgi:DnaJ-class molecular chaperone
VRPSACPDCHGVGFSLIARYYRDPLAGSEEESRDCLACDGTGVCPPVRHAECGGHLRFPHRGAAECADCGADVRLDSVAVEATARGLAEAARGNHG